MKYCIAPEAENKSVALTFKIVLHIYGREFASLTRQAWPNAMLFPRYWGGGFPQTSALLKRNDLSSRCCINHGFHTGDYSLQGLTRKKNDDKDEELVFFA